MLLQLITTNFLQSSVEDIKNEILTSITHPLTEGDGGCSPLERYAIASQLAKAAAEAARQLSDNGISYALSPENGFQPLSGLGKQFEHNGETYQVQFVNEFNYNQGDTNGKEWQKTVGEIEELETRKKSLTKHKKGLEAVILAEHPRLQPTMTKTVLKYLGN